MFNSKSAKLITALSVIVIAGILVFSYLYSHGLTDIRTNPTYKSGQIKVACVGDSVTYGYNLSRKSSYPAYSFCIIGYSILFSHANLFSIIEHTPMIKRKKLIKALHPYEEKRDYDYYRILTNLFYHPDYNRRSRSHTLSGERFSLRRLYCRYGFSPFPKEIVGYSIICLEYKASHIVNRYGFYPKEFVGNLITCSG